jgi:hypothetical protein
VQEYVAVNEFGLALEWAGIGMFDNGRIASSNEVELFRRIADAMSQDPGWYLNEALRRGALPAKLPLSDGP